MANNNITVVYKWTAKPGKLEELKAIYNGVTNQMFETEPGATEVQVYASEAENALYVRDEFKNAAALGLHLSTTAAAHFQQLLQIAVPGAFVFLGDVPDELQQATRSMGLASEFSSPAFGFAR